MLDENLYPQDDMLLDEEAELLDDEDEAPIGYVGGIIFDEKIGDFARNGINALESAAGIAAWKQWCINCLLTERGAYLAYGDTFGISTEEAMHADRDTCENLLTAEITEALEADPYGRTESVQSVDFEWKNSDSVEVSVKIIGIEDVTIDIKTSIMGERRTYG